VHLVGSYDSDISRCTVNKTLNQLISFKDLRGLHNTLTPTCKIPKHFVLIFCFYWNMRNSNSAYFTGSTGLHIVWRNFALKVHARRFDNFYRI